MKVLLIGDIHIPDKSEEIPKEFIEKAEVCDLIICTGDLTEDRVLDRLMKIKKIRAVKGEKDYIDLPQQDLVGVEKMKFGVVHGNQIEEDEDKDRTEELMEFADLLGADVLVTGHTHQPFRTEKNGKVLLNPGSATGVDGKKKTCMVVEVQGTDMVNCDIIVSEK